MSDDVEAVRLVATIGRHHDTLARTPDGWRLTGRALTEP